MLHLLWWVLGSPDWSFSPSLALPFLCLCGWVFQRWSFALVSVLTTAHLRRIPDYTPVTVWDLFNMKVFHHSVLNLYATSGNLLCFLLVGVTQEIVFVDLTFFITLALYTIKVDFKSNLLLKKKTVRFNSRRLTKVLHDIDLLAVSWEKFFLLLYYCCCCYVFVNTTTAF